MIKENPCPGLPWPLVDARWLSSRRQNLQLVTLDGTVEFPAPRFDGDYRAQSGHEGWKREHIPGSRHADFLRHLSVEHPVCNFTCPSPDRLARAFEDLGVNNCSKVVVYDRVDGIWAARLWWMLRSIGVCAYVLDGGWNAWKAAGFTIEDGDAPPVVRGNLQLRPRAGVWADMSRVKSVVQGQERARLICALSEPVFAGEAPNRYARRGHIPRSLNLPARALLEPTTGRYLPVRDLAKKSRMILDDPCTPVILYCGGGISAAVDALVLSILGREDVSIYDGSLQEWAADAGLPLELGPPAPEELRK
jgi:thiosulfate/3-mercaptopyruvate sulfurtransferase